MFYYFHLAIKKIKTKLYSQFERKVKSESSIDLHTFILFLFKETLKNLHIDEIGIYYKTKINKKNTPVIVSHSRLITLLCDGLDHGDFIIKDNCLIEKLADFLITLKTNNNLYEFNNVKWEKQDEGVASVWAGIALIKAYEAIKKQTYLEEAISVYKSIIKNLYTPETGLIHTAGQDFWCANTSSKLAYFCSLILRNNYSKEIEEIMVNSIKICIDNIAEDGHFPYTKIHPNTYILLYHPSVIFYLDKCLESEYLKNDFKIKIKNVSKSALSYLLNRTDKFFRFHEPEFYNFYIITTVTALAAVKGKIGENIQKSIISNILKYFNKNELYLFIDENDYLFNGIQYKFKDVSTVETLYWLVQYLYGK